MSTRKVYLPPRKPQVDVSKLRSKLDAAGPGEFVEVSSAEMAALRATRYIGHEKSSLLEAWDRFAAARAEALSRAFDRDAAMWRQKESEAFAELQTEIGKMR